MDREPRTNPEWLESDPGRHFRYDHIISIIPPCCDNSGEPADLTCIVPTYSEFRDDLFRALATIGIGKILVDTVDCYKLGFNFTKEGDVTTYYHYLISLCAQTKNPLLCFPLIDGAQATVIAQDIVLARESQGATSADTAIFNAIDSNMIWDRVSEWASYVVGIGSTTYHIKNILENAHKGPLLGILETRKLLSQWMTKLPVK